jgi:uncharacterized membrane protein YgcG
MADYRCTKSFYTAGGKKYYTGDLINSSTYNKLTYDCQRNFEEESDDLLSDALTLFTVGEALNGWSNDDNSASNDSFWYSGDSSFSGFDGGDSGGGGASGDW